MAQLPSEDAALVAACEPIKRTVVYILSTPYAGSHFFSLLLGSHSRMMHLGEIKKLGTKDELPGGRIMCRSCNTRDGCPVFRGVSHETVENVYDIIFSNCGPGTSVLVDASKSIPWSERFIKKGGFRFKLVHLIRDPRALVRRWLLSEKANWSHRFRVARRVPRHALSILAGEDWHFFLYKWLSQNQTITTYLKNSGMSSMVVTYRDLARETGRTIQDVVEWIGLDFEPAQLEHWNFAHHGSIKRAYEWVKEQKTSHFDLRWKSDLPERVIQTIAESNPVHDYLSSIGVSLVDDGLTRYQAGERNHP